MKVAVAKETIGVLLPDGSEGRIVAGLAYIVVKEDPFTMHIQFPFGSTISILVEKRHFKIYQIANCASGKFEYNSRHEHSIWQQYVG